MKIAPGRSRPSCRLIGEQIPFETLICGLAPGELRSLLHGGGQTVDWVSLGQSRLISAENVGVQRRAPAEAPISRELADGRVETSTGWPGKIILEAGHAAPDQHLPQSLHLLLAQQWARGGVLSLHAAAILTAAGGILVIGPRGGGKSVLSVSALTVGHGIISDDWILLGGDDRQIQVERLRPFMMLRKSWASEQLQKQLPGLAGRSLGDRPKEIFPLPPDRSEFPVGGPIDRIWLLQRPRSARKQQTQIQPVSPTTALSRIVEANMPLLFSKPFAVERQALMETINTLLRHAPAFVVETGMDIVEEPHASWQRLIQQSTNARTA